MTNLAFALLALSTSALAAPQILAPKGADSYDVVGSAIALGGDLMVVGAHNFGSPGTASGEAFVWQKDSSGQWPQPVALRRLIPADQLRKTPFSPGFGTSVAVSGDIVAVGAPGENTVYVFRNTSVGWGFSQAVRTPSPDIGGKFGRSVALSSQALLVGAPEALTDEDHLIRNQSERAAKRNGAVFTYALSQGEWSLRDSHYADTQELMGWSLAMDGDTAIVGAPKWMDGTRETHKGRAYILQRNPISGRWANVQAIEPDVGPTGGAGTSVAISGEHAVIGAPNAGGADVAGNPGRIVGQGRAYILGLNRRGTWAITSPLNPPEVMDGVSSNEDTFGQAVAIHGSRVLVGSPHRTIGLSDQSGAGEAYQFSLDGDLQKTFSLGSQARSGNSFGQAVSVSADTLAFGIPGRSEVMVVSK